MQYYDHPPTGYSRGGYYPPPHAHPATSASDYPPPPYYGYYNRAPHYISANGRAVPHTSQGLRINICSCHENHGLHGTGVEIRTDGASNIHIGNQRGEQHPTTHRGNESPMYLNTIKESPRLT
eukprot:CAMPEP_0176353030 /NCGR_PEP_ID=MMETSP0126-20121128/11492_1 /TAXON_ID=141414 ORGANISM="Strombidinopsis acuminatum, Strain SPMC142" /NCGR_SAMPLE_ID=MMETSP0126 /ASSEMBLY_ACC=CAM_ASM_000229 /LENGTH=122 /DNA_ID=CAMNT_0017704483 /DNA_START=2094 /DNA_END=2462 /DNA_ORIENTATION=-